VLEVAGLLGAADNSSGTGFPSLPFR